MHRRHPTLGGLHPTHQRSVSENLRVSSSVLVGSWENAALGKTWRTSLVGGFNHLEKLWKSMARIIPYIMGKKCLKPPTSSKIYEKFKWWVCAIVLVVLIHPIISIIPNTVETQKPVAYEQCSKLSVIPLYWVVKNGFPVMNWYSPKYIG